MDGTLIDTETQTDVAIEAVAARYGVPGFRLPHSETRGRTWAHVAETLRAQTGITTPVAELMTTMLAVWNDAVADAKAIPGAPEAIRAATAAGIRVAIVSSSPRSVINYFAGRLGVESCVPPEARIGADSVTRGKPDPEGFLSAARALGATPAESLVFEDSQAGLLAARGATMRSMFITCCAADIPGNRPLATGSLTDYRALPSDFWSGIASGTLAIEGRSFA